MKTQIAICLSTILAFGLSGRVLAQLTAVPMIDTPTQRWLPPPKPFPNQPDSQAKLLSRLRDFVLSKDQSRESNPSRLSNADIQSLKEAMKQFGGNLPDGLTSNSLDAIPPDLISKALSNPELMRQAKELAEQFRKIGRPRSTDGSAKSNESPEQESSRGERNSAESQSKPNVENGLSPVDPGQRPKIPAGDPKSQSKPYKEEFAKLMEKLRSTQQQFEKNQDDATEPLPSTDPTSPVRAPAAPNKDAQKNVSKSGTKPSGLTPPESDPTPTQPPASRGIKRPMPSQKGSLPSTDNPSNQRTPQPERNSKSPNPSWSDSDPFDSKQFNPSMQTELDQSSFLSNAIKDLAIEESQPTAQSPRSSSVDNSSSNVSGGNKSASGSGDSKSTSSMDIRKEMQRRGFGPTLQKIVEEAQRASKSSPASPQPSRSRWFRRTPCRCGRLNRTR